MTTTTTAPAAAAAAQVDVLLLCPISDPDINDDNNNDGKTTWFYWVWRCQGDRSCWHFFFVFTLSWLKCCSPPDPATKLNCKFLHNNHSDPATPGHILITFSLFACFSIFSFLFSDFLLNVMDELEKETKKKYTTHQMKHTHAQILSYKLNLNWHKTH